MGSTSLASLKLPESATFLLPVDENCQLEITFFTAHGYQMISRSSGWLLCFGIGSYLAYKLLVELWDLYPQLWRWNSKHLSDVSASCSLINEDENWLMVSPDQETDDDEEWLCQSVATVSTAVAEETNTPKKSVCRRLSAPLSSSPRSNRCRLVPVYYDVRTATYLSHNRENRTQSSQVRGDARRLSNDATRSSVELSPLRLLFSSDPPQCSRFTEQKHRQQKQPQTKMTNALDDGASSFSAEENDENCSNCSPNSARLRFHRRPNALYLLDNINRDPVQQNSPAAAAINHRLHGCNESKSNDLLNNNPFTPFSVDIHDQQYIWECLSGIDAPCRTGIQLRDPALLMDIDCSGPTLSCVDANPCSSLLELDERTLFITSLNQQHIDNPTAQADMRITMLSPVPHSATISASAADASSDGDAVPCCAGSSSMFELSEFQSLSEFSVVADRPINEVTAQHFERLEEDLINLRDDVSEGLREVAIFAQTDCCQRDFRHYYQSVLIDDNTSIASTFNNNIVDCLFDDNGSIASPKAPSSTCDSHSYVKYYRRQQGSCNRGSSHAKSEPPQQQCSSSSVYRKLMTLSLPADIASHEALGLITTSATVETSSGNGVFHRSMLRNAVPKKNKNPLVDSAYAESAVSSSGVTPESVAAQNFNNTTPKTTPGDASLYDSGIAFSNGSSHSLNSLPPKTTVDVDFFGNVTASSTSFAHKSMLPVLDEEILRTQLCVPSTSQVSSCSSDSFAHRKHLQNNSCNGSFLSVDALLEWEDEAINYGETDDVYLPSCSSNLELLVETLLRPPKQDTDVENTEPLIHENESNNNCFSIPEFCEQFFPKNELTLKVLKKLEERYESSHITVFASSTDKAALVDAVLCGLWQKGLSVFRCRDFSVVLEALELSFKRCRCLQLWPFPTSVAGDSALAKMKTCFILLWKYDELHAANSSGPLSAFSLEERFQLMEAVKFLMLLRALDAYEFTVFSRQPPSEFYLDFFKFSTSELVLSVANLCWKSAFSDNYVALLGDALGVRLDVHRPGCCGTTNTVTVFPSIQPPATSGNFKCSLTLIAMQPDFSAVGLMQ